MTTETKSKSDTKGKLIAFMNDDKKPAGDRPAFNGRLTLPGDDCNRSFALWMRKDKAERILLTGQTSSQTGSAMDQIAGLLDKKPAAAVADIMLGKGTEPLVLSAHEIVLFQNKASAKGGKSADKDASKRPDFYGWHHTGEPGKPAVRLAVWAKTDVKGNAYLTGTVRPLEQVQLQDEVLSQDQDQFDDSEPELAM